jgi:hypothetical protein
MSNQHNLLNAEQMAQFVTNGYLQLNDLIPTELNDTVLNDMIKWKGSTEDRGYNDAFWKDCESVRTVFELPQVKGVLNSLVGMNPRYDHTYLHMTPPNTNKPQAYHWHQDGSLDIRIFSFDVQIFYFPQEVTNEMGATGILPGSHMRKVSTGSTSRYKNIVGQKQVAGKAGQLVFMHHNMWHTAMPNISDKPRFMFHLRFNPRQEQRNLFNKEGYRDEEIRKIIMGPHHPWHGNEDRTEQVMRALLWRYVTGDDEIDFSFEGILSRMSIKGYQYNPYHPNIRI